LAKEKRGRKNAVKGVAVAGLKTNLRKGEKVEGAMANRKESVTSI